MSGKKREYSSLDSVFNRLQVSPVEERHNINGDANALDNQQPAGKEGRIEQLIGKKLKAKRRRKTRKCVIRKAKLILPKTFSVKKEDSGLNNKDDSDDEVFLSDSDSCTSGAPATCGAQYLQQGTTSQSAAGTVDSSPDELASYFEQILFIPKPMSMMAQMMYA